MVLCIRAHVCCVSADCPDDAEGESEEQKERPQPPAPSGGANANPGAANGGRRNPPGGKSSLILGWTMQHTRLSILHWNAFLFLFFQKWITPQHTLPLHCPVPHPQPPSCSTCTRLVIPLDPSHLMFPTTFNPFCFGSFSIKNLKKKQLVDKSTLCISARLNLHFSPSCSALRLLGKAWCLAYLSLSSHPLHYPLPVYGQGKISNLRGGKKKKRFDAWISNNKDWYRFVGPFGHFCFWREDLVECTMTMFLLVQMGALQNVMILIIWYSGSRLGIVCYFGYRNTVMFLVAKACYKLI